MTRVVEQELAAALMALSGYRRARWRAVILYGMTDSGKTVLAQALADDAQVQRSFRDGILWADGSRDPAEEVERLCLALGLERLPGERPVETWQRWTTAPERRLLLIVDAARTGEALRPLVAGLGPQVAVLATTQQGFEVRAELERWLPADQVLALAVGGLMPEEGRQLVEAVVGRPLVEAEWTAVQEIGALIGWQPEALRLAAIEGREIGWEGALAELSKIPEWGRAGRLPWAEVKRLVMRQWARLPADQQGWLAALVEGSAAGAWLTGAEAARLWEVDAAVARRRLWALRWQGLMDEGQDAAHWRMAASVHLALDAEMQWCEMRGSERQ